MTDNKNNGTTGPTSGGAKFVNPLKGKAAKPAVAPTIGGNAAAVNALSPGPKPGEHPQAAAETAAPVASPASQLSDDWPQWCRVSVTNPPTPFVNNPFVVEADDAKDAKDKFLAANGVVSTSVPVSVAAASEEEIEAAKADDGDDGDGDGLFE